MRVVANLWIVLGYWISEIIVPEGLRQFVFYLLAGPSHEGERRGRLGDAGVDFSEYKIVIR
jgi:hypothetical protein